MTVRIGLFAASLLLILYVHASNELDSLISRIGKSPSPIEEVDLLNTISSKHFNRNPKLTEEYAVKALKIAESINYPKGSGVALRYIGISYAIRGNFQEARVYYNKALTLFNELQDFESQAATYYALAITYDQTGEYERATQFYNRALTIQKSIHDTSGMANTYVGIGNMFKRISRPDVSLQYYDSAQVIYSATGNIEKIALIYNNMASVYLGELEYSNALKNIYQALAINDSLNLKSKLSFNYLSLGNIYNMLNEQDLAKEYLWQSYTIRKELGMTKGMAICLSNIGVIEMGEKQYEPALMKFTEALMIYDSFEMKCNRPSIELNIGEIFLHLGLLDSSSIWLNRSLKNATNCQMDIEIGGANLYLGKLFLAKDEPVKAEYHFLEVMKYSHNQPMAEKVKDAAFNLYKLYRSYKNDDLSLKYLESYTAITDTLSNRQKSLDVARTESKYLFEKEKSKLSQSYKNNLLLKETEIQKQILQKKSLAIILALVVIILFMSVFYYLKTKRKSYKILQQSNELKESQYTTERLLAIISHDIRSPLSSLETAIQLLKNEDLTKQEFDACVDDVSGRTGNLFILLENILKWTRVRQNDLSPQFHSLDAVQTFKECFDLLRPAANHKGLKVELESAFEQLYIEGDEEMIKTICRNLLSNAIKFCKPKGSVHLSLNKTETHLSFTVKDEGVGMSEEVKNNLFVKTLRSSLGTTMESGAGIGLFLCKEFIQNHKGTIQIESTLMEGTSITVNLPLSQ